MTRPGLAQRRTDATRGGSLGPDRRGPPVTQPAHATAPLPAVPRKGACLGQSGDGRCHSYQCNTQSGARASDPPDSAPAAPAISAARPRGVRTPAVPPIYRYQSIRDPSQPPVTSSRRLLYTRGRAHVNHLSFPLSPSIIFYPVRMGGEHRRLAAAEVDLRAETPRRLPTHPNRPPAPRPPFSPHVPSYRYRGLTTAGRRACQEKLKSACKVRRSHIRMNLL